MVEEETLKRGPKNGGKRRVRRGRVSLTQYFESQEDQDMTRLLNFLELKRGEERGVLCLFK